MERTVPVRVIVLLVALLVSAGTAYPAQVVLDSDKQYAFAGHFVEREEYDRAVQELERLVYFFPDDPRVPEARYMVGWCYLKIGRFERARKILWEVHDAYRPREVAAKALYLVGESYRMQGIPEEAAYYFGRVTTEFPDTSAAQEAAYRLGWVHLETGRWGEASAAFERVGETGIHRDAALALSKRSLEGETLSTKSPTAAGVMAGVLPGLGHAYCERYRDAAVAFLINGAFAWAAVEAFERDQDVLGGLLGFMGLGFYTGNIYSAVNSAHQYNDEARKTFIESLPEHLGLFYSGKDVGLAFRFEF